MYLRLGDGGGGVFLPPPLCVKGRANGPCKVVLHSLKILVNISNSRNNNSGNTDGNLIVT